MSMEFEREPLAIDAFAPNLQNHIKDGAPPKMKMMAAQGMVPAPPEQQVQVLYQLHFDEAVGQAAADSLKGMPGNLLEPIVAGKQPAAVLDWMADVIEERELLQKLVLNQETDDATVYRLAGQADAELCDIIGNNQVRILRSPAILHALYTNSNAKMATLDRALELAIRNEIDLSPFPELRNAARGAQADDEEGMDEASFEAMLEQESQKAGTEKKKLDKLEDDGLTRSERERLEKELVEEDEEEEGEGASRGGNVRQKIMAMNIAQKIRLATVGSREAIKILIRDPNKLIHMAAIQSPRLKLGDIKRLSSNKSLPDGVINYMAKNREWTSDYEVLVNLSMNPKTPLSEVTGFLKHLRVNDLRQLSRNRNVSHQVSRMAKRMMKRRGR